MAGTFAERLIAAIAGTHAVIDLDAYATNVREMRMRLEESYELQLMAVVKANAYGHGALMCARTALDAGADWLGVARIDEAVSLRDQGITAPILALGPFNTALIAQAARSDVSIAIGSTGGLDRIQPALAQLDNEPLRVHLKVDTGMHRYGVYPDEAVELAGRLREEPGVEFEGIFTHFATADDEDETFLQEQGRRFADLLNSLNEQELLPPLIHASNSAASIQSFGPEQREGHSVLFRPGLALYGLPPSADVPTPPEFQRVMALKSRLGRVFTLEPGEGVSYGLTWVADEPTRCGTVPIGYGDGVNRLLSNRGWMSVQGKRCPIIGRVCMDQTVIDLSAVPDAQEGEEAVVFGDGSAGEMTADDAASIIGTINYEVTTAVLPRVPRLYLRDGEPVAVEDLAGLVERS